MYTEKRNKFSEMHGQICHTPVSLVKHNIFHRLQFKIHLHKNVHQSAWSCNNSEIYNKMALNMSNDYTTRQYF